MNPISFAYIHSLSKVAIHTIIIFVSSRFVYTCWTVSVSIQWSIKHHLTINQLCKMYLRETINTVLLVSSTRSVIELFNQTGPEATQSSSSTHKDNNGTLIKSTFAKLAIWSSQMRIRQKFYGGAVVHNFSEVENQPRRFEQLEYHDFKMSDLIFKCFDYHTGLHLSLLTMNLFLQPVELNEAILITSCIFLGWVTQKDRN